MAQRALTQTFKDHLQMYIQITNALQKTAFL